MWPCSFTYAIFKQILATPSCYCKWVCIAWQTVMQVYGWGRKWNPGSAGCEKRARAGLLAQELATWVAAGFQSHPAGHEKAGEELRQHSAVSTRGERRRCVCTEGRQSRGFCLHPRAGLCSVCGRTLWCGEERKIRLRVLMSVTVVFKVPGLFGLLAQHFLCYFAL